MTLRVENAADFQACRARWTSLVAAGELDQALDLVDVALVWARRQDDPALLDRAVCNRAAIAFELGRGEELVPELRALLLRSEDGENCFLAAYTIARHYELAREARKGLFYARLARDRAIALDDSRRGSSLNLIANFQVSASRFDDALASYAEAERALEVADGKVAGDALRAAVIGYNVGYCRVVTGDLAGGLGRLYRSLRALVAQRAERHEMLARLDLTFALLEANKPVAAARHAARALALAARFADETARKNALYLAGAAATARGDEVGARRHFVELQGAFFPEADYLPEILLRVDVRQMVNLKA
jgi:ATP/maltotriose-dependent transcriptional regulator MalT